MIKNIFLIKGIVALCTLMASIATVTALNSVFSIIGLIFTFILASGYLLLTGIEYIAISYIIIYVGAIAILFLFVILMINIEIKNVTLNSNQLLTNLPLGVSIFTIFTYMFLNLFPVFMTDLFSTIYAQSVLLKYSYYNYLMSNLNYSDFQLIYSIDQIESLAINLYTYHSILIILLAFILLLAMLASIELSIEKKNRLK
jgi:NADH-ubiquinone oxidoreductase chain 6